MKNLLQISGLVVAALLVLAAPAWAADSGQFTEVAGQVTVQKPGGQSIPAVLGTVVGQGDKIMTAKGSKATLLFQDG